MSAYDAWQLPHDLGSKDAALVNVYGKNITHQVWKNLLLGSDKKKDDSIQRSHRNGVFLDACVEHCGGFNIRIGGDTQASAMKKWYDVISHKMEEEIWIQSFDYPCPDCCQGSGGVYGLSGFAPFVMSKS